MLKRDTAEIVFRMVPHTQQELGKYFVPSRKYIAISFWGST